MFNNQPTAHILHCNYFSTSYVHFYLVRVYFVDTTFSSGIVQTGSIFTKTHMTPFHNKYDLPC